MTPLLIIKAGSKIHELDYIPGDYEHWIARGMGLDEDRYQVVDLAAGEPLPPLDEVAGVVITGSGAMVTEQQPWMEQCAVWLREAVTEQLPLLGICFGHQLLAWALGGEVADNPRGVEVGTQRIELTDRALSDPLLSVLPTAFDAQLSHVQSVLQLPRGARLLAASAMDPHQAFTWGGHAWGIQFHPEFNASVTRQFVEHYRPQLEQQGRDVEAMLAAVHEAPESSALLRRFAVMVAEAAGWS